MGKKAGRRNPPHMVEVPVLFIEGLLHSAIRDVAPRKGDKEPFHYFISFVFSCFPSQVWPKPKVRPIPFPTTRSFHGPPSRYSLCGAILYHYVDYVARNQRAPMTASTTRCGPSTRPRAEFPSRRRASPRAARCVVAGCNRDVTQHEMSCGGLGGVDHKGARARFSRRMVQISRASLTTSVTSRGTARVWDVVARSERSASPGADAMMRHQHPMRGEPSGRGGGARGDIPVLFRPSFWRGGGARLSFPKDESAFPIALSANNCDAELMVRFRLTLR